MSTNSALVVGGGIAGIQAAIDLAERGIKVKLVEKQASIGGRMAQLDKTFPTNDCSMCILAPKMIECFDHPNIDVLTYSELQSVEGQAGDFKVKIRKKARYVKDNCTACGDCAKVCPVPVKSTFDEGLSEQRAIHIPFPQAVPKRFVINRMGVPPCQAGCPIHQNAQGYVTLVAQGKYREAMEVILRDNPLPSVCGRVCTHPCMKQCTRLAVDEAVNIPGIKRFVSDWVLDNGESFTLPPPSKERAEKIAVVGSGPAGLMCAFELRRRGFQVVVFEALPVAGGMLAIGIPEFRLPKKVLNDEIEKFKDMGIEIKLSSPIGGNGQTLDDLRQQFDAVFLGVGAHVERRLGIAGEEMPGVYGGLEFLRAVNLPQAGNGKALKLDGKKVIVIGGGNSAIDAARTAVREGAREVRIAYRRTRHEMPADESEIEGAIEEGVVMDFLVAPLKVNGEGQATSVQFQKMALGEPDDSGRRRPEPVAGSEYDEACDVVIATIGQLPNLTGLGRETTLETTSWKTLQADPVTLQTSLPGVFGGGDCVSGPDVVVTAMSAGKKAAVSIERFLDGAEMAVGRELEDSYKSSVTKSTADVAIDHQLHVHSIPVTERKSYREVHTGYTEAEARHEAQRCLDCGVCCDCHLCATACKADAIDFFMKDEILEENVGAIVVANGLDYYSIKGLDEYGYGLFPNVLTAMEFERIICASGPTRGHIERPSDHKVPETIAFIQCVGSRDVHCMPYCTTVCCMHSTKEAILANEHEPDLKTFIFYTDMRAMGKGFWAYTKRAEREYKVNYVRSKPGSVTEEANHDLTLWYEDTSDGTVKSMTVGMVVLAQALKPSTSTRQLSEILGLAVDDYGFFQVADKLRRPVDTDREGIYVCGFCQMPQDIPDSVVQASAAACRAAELIVGGKR